MLGLQVLTVGQSGIVHRVGCHGIGERVGCGISLCSGRCGVAASLLLGVDTERDECK